MGPLINSLAARYHQSLAIPGPLPSNWVRIAFQGYGLDAIAESLDLKLTSGGEPVIHPHHGAPTYLDHLISTGRVRDRLRTILWASSPVIVPSTVLARGQ